MSSRNLARRTKAEVSFGGIDITKSIQPYLLSISYTDNEEDETDDLQIKIQDRDDLWLTQWLDEISEKLSWASPSGGSASGDAVVSEANKYLGTPYVWGGSSPSGFDCSGLVYYALNEAGISVPRTTAQGYKDMATPVNEATAQPGDLIFFGTQGVVDHVVSTWGMGQCDRFVRPDHRHQHPQSRDYQLGQNRRRHAERLCCLCTGRHAKQRLRIFYFLWRTGCILRWRRRRRTTRHGRCVCP